MRTFGRGWRGAPSLPFFYLSAASEKVATLGEGRQTAGVAERENMKRSQVWMKVVSSFTCGRVCQRGLEEVTDGNDGAD